MEKATKPPFFGASFITSNPSEFVLTFGCFFDWSYLFSGICLALTGNRFFVALDIVPLIELLHAPPTVYQTLPLASVERVTSGTYFYV